MEQGFTDTQRRAVLNALRRSTLTGMRAAFTPCTGLKVVEESWGELSRDELIAVHSNVEHGLLHGTPDDAELGRLIRAAVTRYALSSGDLPKADEQLRAAAADAKAELRSAA